MCYLVTIARHVACPSGMPNSNGTHSGSRSMRFGLVAVLVVGALTLVGRDAEAQARGTLQATATVVDTRQGFGALSAVRQALTDSRIESRHAVETVAVVSTARPATSRSTVVVTVDFSRN